MARRLRGGEVSGAALGIVVGHKEDLETLPASLGAAVERAAGAKDDAQQGGEAAIVKQKEFKHREMGHKKRHAKINNLISI